MLKEGDNNSKKIYAHTKQRRSHNMIIGLYNEVDIWVDRETEIERVAVKYFWYMFTTISPSGIDEVLEEVPTVVTAQMNESVTTLATGEEVWKALFMMHPEKAPDPDGMTALFFQRVWQVIKGDLLELVSGFLRSGSFDKKLNETNFCLIPNMERPTRMANLRPISLCNVRYKIISKVFCQRLTKLLPDMIFETQSPFISGKFVSFNILIAQEMFYGLRTNKSCKTSFMATKTNMSKAYDHVE